MKLCGIILAFAAAAQAQNSPCFAPAPPAVQIKACSDAIAGWSAPAGMGALSAYYAKRASLYADSRDFDHAMEDANKAVEIAPRNDDALLGRGWILMRSEKYAAAVKDLVPVLRSKNRRKAGWAYYSLAVNYYLIGKNAAAQTHAAAGKINAPELYSRYLQELDYFVTSRERRAREAAESFENGKRLLAAGDGAGAIDSFAASLSSAPGNAECSQWLASAYYEAGKPADLLKAFGAMSEEMRWNYYIGLSLLKLGRLSDAVAAFTLAQSEAPPKNRGRDIAQEAKDYVSRILSYQQSMGRASKMSTQGAPPPAVLAEYENARKSLDTPDVRRAMERVVLEQQIAEKDRRAGVTHMIVLSMVLVVSVVGIIFVFRRYRRIVADREQRRENAFGAVTSKPARDAVMAYFDFKADQPEDASELASRLLGKVAASRDFELIKTFIGELDDLKKRELLAAAAADFAGAGGYDASIDALQILNMIPFLSWGEAETSAFIAAHLAADNVLLTPDVKKGAAVWAPDIPLPAYMKLACAYAARHNNDFTERVMEHLPVYKWEKAQWDLYIATKEAAARLDTLDISAVPAQFRLYVVETLVRKGRHHAKVVEFLTNEPRQKWLKEYYLYMFLYLMRDHHDEPFSLHFDSAWEQYKQMNERFNIRAAPAVHYMFGIVCERLGRFDRAADLYGYFKEAAIIYKDEIKRLTQIKAGQESEISPSALEILSQMLPEDFFPPITRSNEEIYY